MLTAAEQRKVAKEFAKRWEGRGYEKGESQSFWLSLLHEVYGIKDPTGF
ncbi:MAG: methylase, partial [Clostridiales bacterium]|nr:methylase [Clostridiales bacterium]